MATSVHCDLCDLPQSFCQHGLALRQGRVAKKKTKPALGSQVKVSAAKKGPGFPRRPDKCIRCGEKAPQGRYWMCTRCLLRTGAAQCSLCKKAFKTETGLPSKKSKCRSCRMKRKGSAWVVASAGSPGLGKGR